MLDQNWKQLSTQGRIGGPLYARRSVIPGVVEIRQGNSPDPFLFFAEAELLTLFLLLEW